MLRAMKIYINLEEPIGKWVGRREPKGTIEEIYQRLVRLGRGLHPGTHLPRGVYYFSNFEDAHQWEWNHMMKRASRLSPASRISPTSPASAPN